MHLRRLLLLKLLLSTIIKIQLAPAIDEDKKGMIMYKPV